MNDTLRFAATVVLVIILFVVVLGALGRRVGIPELVIWVALLAITLMLMVRARRRGLRT